MCQKSNHSENATPTCTNLALTEIAIPEERLAEFAGWLTQQLEQLERDWKHFSTRRSRRGAAKDLRHSRGEIRD